MCQNNIAYALNTFLCHILSLLTTHDKQTMEAKVCGSLSEVDDIYQQYDVIGIDEGQFFPDLNSFCEKAANNGKVVVGTSSMIAHFPHTIRCNAFALTLIQIYALYFHSCRTGWHF